jgi:hypothetical protein
MTPEDLAVVGPSLPGVSWPLDGLQAPLRYLGKAPGVIVTDRALIFSCTPDDGDLDLAAFPLLGPTTRTTSARRCSSDARGVPRQVRLAELRGRRIGSNRRRRARPVHRRLEATNVDAALVGIGAVSGAPGM